MKKVNFHSHTIYSKHATNTSRFLIEKAIENGFKVFGISEHIPLGDFWDNGGVDENDVAKLVAEVSQLKQEYKDKIEIYMGLESEYHPAFKDIVKWWYETPAIEYMLFGNHIYDVADGKCVRMTGDQQDLIDKQIEYLELAGQSGMFSYYCHPDLFLNVYKKWDDDAKRLADAYIEASIKYNMPLEININGLFYKMKNGNWYQYPAGIFWEHVAKSDAKVIIGVDSHDAETMDDRYFEAAKLFVKEHGLEKNLATSIKLKNKTIDFND